VARSSSPKATAGQTRPNVLLVLTDDQGWDDLGYHGNRLIETRRLDRLASESVTFDNFYATPVCAPTRAALLTGRHFLRTGVSHVHGGRDFVHPDEVLLGQVLRAAGYRTGMWGKWHSGKTTGYFPWERGFDEAYMARLYKHRDSIGRFNGEERSHTGWTVDTLTDYALEFIRRNAGLPWFAFVPYLTVHAPLEAPEEMVRHYRAKGMGETLALVYAMVQQMDTNVGRLLDELDRLGSARDTVVVFLSDNGPQYFPDMPSQDVALRCVSRYKGHKGGMWENGIKVPLFVRWPGHLAARRVRRLCDVCDLFPTVLDLCGVPLPPGHPELDGRSIRLCLEGRESGVPPRESVIFSNVGWPPEKNAGQAAFARDREYETIPSDRKRALPFGEQLCGLRTEEHKILLNEGYAAGAPSAVNGAVLVDMAVDPREDTNIVSAHPELAAGMRGRLQEWFARVIAEPHSFHNPVFAVGPGTTNVVLAYGAQRTFGHVHTGVNESYDWRAPGDGAEYLVRVVAAGGYSLTLLHGKPSGQVRLRLTAAGAALEADASAEGRTEFGTLRLPAGEHLLRLEIVECGPGAELGTVRETRFGAA